MTMKEKYQAKVRINKLNDAVDKAAKDLNRDIMSAERDFAPFGSNAMIRRTERTIAQRRLIEAIFLAKLTQS